MTLCTISASLGSVGRLSLLLRQTRNHPQPHLLVLTGAWGCRCYSSQHETSHDEPKMKLRSRKVLKSLEAYHCHWETSADARHLLLNSVIYEDDHMVALNKPSRLPIKGRGAQYIEAGYRAEELMFVPQDTVSLNTLLPDLADHWGADKLTTALAQHRLCSGITVLAKTAKAKDRLQAYFSSLRTSKAPNLQYIAVTGSVPEKKSGEIKEFAVSRQTVQDQVMSFVVEEPSRRHVKSGRVCRATIAHETLDATQHAAFVRLQSNFVKWENLQLYLTEETCSVLGDHVYSSRVANIFGSHVRLRPELCVPQTQRLSAEVQRGLGFPSSRLPLLPLHLHCWRLKLPRLDTHPSKQEMVTITAPLPEFFLQSAASLGLKAGVDSLDTLG